MTMNYPVWIEDMPDSVKIIHGISEGWFKLAGRSVAAVQMALADPFGIPSNSVTFVNGERTAPSYILRPKDSLEFVCAAGMKGMIDLGDDSLVALKRHCAALPPGPVADIATLERLLAAVWNNLISDDPSMEGYKLLGRMEAVVWNAPVLSFRIERHGGTVLGSSRAEVRKWTVDLDKITTTVNPVGRRQVRRTQPRFDVKPIAAELFNVIIGGQPDDRLKWEGDSKVRVLIGKILPDGSAVKDTLVGRRKGLREELTQLLAQAGWKLVRPNVYEKES